MRTNIDIDDELMSAALRLTGLKTKKENCGTCPKDLDLPKTAGKD